jgi:hypothetical protein
MKSKTFFEKLNRQGKINNEDMNKALETLPDFEIPDVWVNMVEENFLTRERASADFEISKRIKAESLNGVDEKFKLILPLLDPTDRETLEKEINTYKKIESLPAALQKIIDKAKTENPNNDEVIKKLKADVKEFADKVTAINQEKESALKEAKERHESEKSDLKLNWTLEKKFGEFKIADEFEAIKPAIIKNTIDTIRATNALQIDDKGQIVVVDIDPTTKTAKPKFNGNDPVTIDSLLADPLKPFLKKNEGGAPPANTRTNTRTALPETQTQTAFRPKAKANTPV